MGLEKIQNSDGYYEEMDGDFIVYDNDMTKKQHIKAQILQIKMRALANAIVKKEKNV